MKTVEVFAEVNFTWGNYLIKNGLDQLEINTFTSRIKREINHSDKQVEHSQVHNADLDGLPSMD